MLSSTNFSEDELAASFNGQQIANLLRTDGPIVSCVLLHSTVAVSSSSSAPTKGDKGRQSLTGEETDTLNFGEKKKEASEVPSSNIDNDSETITKKSRALLDNCSNDGGIGINEKGSDTPKTKSRVVLTDQISQIMVDTTPKKSMVAQILGGPFTFLGQYEEEGIIAMVRRQPETKDESETGDSNNDDENQELSINPHQLQPPLHKARIYGDILLMKVAPCDEDEDDDNDNVEPRDRKGNKEKEASVESPASDSGSKPDTKAQKVSPSSSSDEENQVTAATTKEDRPQYEAEPKPTKLLSNEDFFLNYTKEEYIRFSSRTDIVPPPEKEDEEESESEERTTRNYNEEDGVDSDGIDNDDDEEEEGDDEDDNDNDEDFVTNWGSDDEDLDEEDEDCQISMMNLILAQIIKRFREENGRGPNTEELLAMKSALVEKLGIEDLINDTGDNSNNNEDEGEGAEPSSSLNDDDDDNQNDNDNRVDNANENETTTAVGVAAVGVAADGGNEVASPSSQDKANKRKVDAQSSGGREKRVKFTNKNQVKLIPAIELKRNSDDDEEEEYDCEGEVEEEEEDMVVHDDIELEEGEGEI